MPKRSRSAMFPLLSGPASEGLSLRDQIYKTCLAAIVDGRLAEAHGCLRRGSWHWIGAYRATRSTTLSHDCRRRGFSFAASAPARSSRRRRASRRARGAQRRRPSALGRKALAAVSAWGRSATSSLSLGQRTAGGAVPGGNAGARRVSAGAVAAARRAAPSRQWRRAARLFPFARPRPVARGDGATPLRPRAESTAMPGRS